MIMAGNYKRWEEIRQMRMNGATFQEIADALGVSKQCVNELFNKQYRKLKGMRGYGFKVDSIVYKGIYEHFMNNPFETVSSFTEKIYGYVGNKPQTIRDFITGKNETWLTIPRIQKMCEITGKTFEELFERR